MSRAPSIPAAQRRAHAVRALLELAGHTAPDQISTAAIAAEMGVSHAALFRHFPTREALWAEAVHWATAELGRHFSAADPDPARPPLERLEALLLAHARFLENHPGLLRMLFAELQRPHTSPAREEGRTFMAGFRQRLAALIEQARQAGTLAEGVDPAELAGLLVAVNQGLMLQGLAWGHLESLSTRTRRGIATVLSGVRR